MGIALLCNIELAVAINVKGGIITSSPGPISKAAIDICNAAVPVLTPIACFTPM